VAHAEERPKFEISLEGLAQARRSDSDIDDRICERPWKDDIEGDVFERVTEELWIPME
jgi:hypothetical protein